MADKKKKDKKGGKPEAETDAEGATPPAEGEAVEGAEGEGKKKKLSGKALILFIVLPAVLVLGGGGAAAYLLLFSGHPTEQHAEAGEHGKAKGGHGEEASADPTPGPNGTTIMPGEAGVTFVGLPEMLVNITGADGRTAYLKLKLTIEAPNEAAVTALTSDVPRVTDEFNGFLREMRTDDLAGSAGAYRLRLELLRRVNLAIAPAQVNAVLIEEMLVQ